MNRLKLLLLLATLDDEAFAWLLIALHPTKTTAGHNIQIWPDGLGGFQDRATISAIQAEADELLKS